MTPHPPEPRAEWLSARGDRPSRRGWLKARPRRDSDRAVPAEGEAGEARQAMLAYLTVPFFGFVVPFAIYVIALRRSRWLRAHAARALNVWITVLLYDVSAAIMGTMLALDSPAVALMVVLPLLVLLWLVTLAYLVRAATAASQGREFSFPRWLCSPMVR